MTTNFFSIEALIQQISDEVPYTTGSIFAKVAGTTAAAYAHALIDLEQGTRNTTTEDGVAAWEAYESDLQDLLAWATGQLPANMDFSPTSVVDRIIEDLTETASRPDTITEAEMRAIQQDVEDDDIDELDIAMYIQRRAEDARARLEAAERCAESVKGRIASVVAVHEVDEYWVPTDLQLGKIADATVAALENRIARLKAVISQAVIEGPRSRYYRHLAENRASLKLAKTLLPKAQELAQRVQLEAEERTSTKPMNEGEYNAVH